jgi:hypothetical protein
MIIDSSSESRTMLKDFLLANNHDVVYETQMALKQLKDIF